MSCAHAAGIRPATFGVLRLPRNIVVGAQQRFAIADIAAELGDSVLICTDPRLAASDELHSLVMSLESRKLSVRVYGETQAELPTPGIIDCVKELKGQDIDVVIGFGGGSWASASVSDASAFADAAADACANSCLEMAASHRSIDWSAMARA